MSHGQLPDPTSAELHVAVRSTELRRIYEFLYENRDHPPTMVEIETYLREVTGNIRSQRGRRVRELYPTFQIDKTPTFPPRYLLVGWKSNAETKPKSSIGRRVRAQVLQPQRCAMCGKTPLDDGVKLVVDHKLPQAWGGTDDLDNLQPLCEMCNSGKKDHFGTFDEFADKIKQAATFMEPQRRIGELFLAFGTDEWIRSDLLAMVANAKEFQEDWHRRMRDLRYIGWDYAHRNRRENGRVRSYYKLTKSAPWPDDILGEIKREFDRRRTARQKK